MAAASAGTSLIPSPIITRPPPAQRMKICLLEFPNNDFLQKNTKMQCLDMPPENNFFLGIIDMRKQCAGWETEKKMFKPWNLIINASDNPNYLHTNTIFELDMINSNIT